MNLNFLRVFFVLVKAIFVLVACVILGLILSLQSQ